MSYQDPWQNYPKHTSNYRFSPLIHTQVHAKCNINTSFVLVIGFIFSQVCLHVQSQLIKLNQKALVQSYVRNFLWLVLHFVKQKFATSLIFVFSAELGGLMGMLIGASWITIGELFVFYIGFFVLLLKFICCPKILRS